YKTDTRWPYRDLPFNYHLVTAIPYHAHPRTSKGTKAPRHLRVLLFLSGAPRGGLGGNTNATLSY
ncbi:MAG: hypothetical protein V3U90_04100, partial [Dehalococcoidia bacterium]